IAIDDFGLAATIHLVHSVHENSLAREHGGFKSLFERPDQSRLPCGPEPSSPVVLRRADGRAAGAPRSATMTPRRSCPANSMSSASPGLRPAEPCTGLPSAARTTAKPRASVPL